MTNTITVEAPLSAIDERRRLWLEEISGLAASSGLTPSEAFLLLARLRMEGPSLARCDHWRWQRRFRWIDLQLDRGREQRWILLQALIDLNYTVADPRPA